MDEKDAFYVVRKGDMIGIYRSLEDCQAQDGPFACSPPLTVYKGYNLSKETEEYLVSHGLRNASYSLGSADVKDDIFGKLAPCPFQQPLLAEAKVSLENLPRKRSSPSLGSENVSHSGSTSANLQTNNVKVDMSSQSKSVFSAFRSCILKFDGASKGNPGPAGAGAILYAEDGSVICRLHEGVGVATNNVAEYRGLILGLKHALKKGYKRVQVFGDSNLVCKQVDGSWKTKNPNMADLCKEAKQLKDQFLSFSISHVERALNSEADVEANSGVNLRVGQVVEDYGKQRTFG